MWLLWTELSLLLVLESQGFSTRIWESRVCTKLMLFSLHWLLVGSILDVWEPLPAFSELLAEKPSRQAQQAPKGEPRLQTSW